MRVSTREKKRNEQQQQQQKTKTDNRCERTIDLYNVFSKHFVVDRQWNKYKEENKAESFLAVNKYRVFH